MNSQMPKPACTAFDTFHITATNAASFCAQPLVVLAVP